MFDREARGWEKAIEATKQACLGDVKPRKTFVGKVLFSRRLKLRGLIESTDMKMRLRRPGETFASQS